MSKKKKHNPPKDVVAAFKKANREIELERNGGRWIAMERPHQNKKKYNRKAQKNVGFSELLFFLEICYGKRICLSHRVAFQFLVPHRVIRFQVTFLSRTSLLVSQGIENIVSIVVGKERNPISVNLRVL